MNLTKTQNEIVNNIDSSLLITAPAGAGKTEVMARRAQKAIENGKKNILCLTFTNRAANSMKKRIADPKDKNAKISVYTFHAFCNSLLRQESDYMGLPFNYIILDKEDTSAILKEVLSKTTSHLSAHDLKAAKTLIDDYRLSSLIHKENVTKIIEKFNSRFKSGFVDVYNKYQAALSESNSLDFTSLIALTYEFFSNPTNLMRWQKIYDFIQVDEMQDTGLIEYDIISKLASHHKNLSLFGDTDQTIYEWRDSRPFEIIAQFKEKFSPTEYILADNFRSTKTINKCAESFLDSYFQRQSKNIIASSEQGDKVHLCFLKDFEYEKKQICKIISSAHEKASFKDIAILTRTNKDAINFSHALNDNNIPAYIIDEYNFFRREEIKDVICLLKLLQNKSDISCAKRILLKYAKNIGIATVNEIIESQLPVALEDLICHAHKENFDLLDDIITPFLDNNMVIFDVESTGLDTNKDEIVEIAAVKYGVNGISDEFHHYLKTDISVGNSEAVHGYSDEFLSEKGEDPTQILSDFLKFSNGCILGGHNVTYDIAILKSQLSRLDIEQNIEPVYFDTLTAAKRIINDSENYKLGTLCSYLGIEEEPTHHAMDDVYATCELANVCFEEFMESAQPRGEFYEYYKPKFAPFSSSFEKLEIAIRNKRPVDALMSIYEFLDVKTKYKDSKNKLNNLNELVRIFKALDETDLSPAMSIKKILEITTLSNSCERLLGDDDKVAVLTIHQAKGLQFNTIIIPNAVDGSIPSSLNIKYDNLDEEARLFYVAMTRASKSLFITLSKEAENGQNNASSRFIKYLPKDCYIIHSQV